MHDFNVQKYRDFWNALNRELDDISTDGLGAALNALHAQQLDQGFILDDLTSMRRYLFTDPQSDRYFAAQFNPARARRFNGAGRKQPPQGAQAINDGCFLCPHNIQWQQRGIEVGYDLVTENRHYVAWMNPYPLLPCHAVIATREHIPQAWSINGASGSQRDLQTVIGDLANLASLLPGWIGFYNGENAGASIPYHLHYQFLRRPEHYDRFPLEYAAAGQETDGSVVKGCYPVDFAYWRGTLDRAKREALPRLQSMAMDVNRRGEFTANVVAVAGETSDELELYFVPRDPGRARSPEMSGLIGGLEVLGELIFSTDEEKRRLDEGEIDFSTVEQILASVAVPI